MVWLIGSAIFKTPVPNGVLTRGLKGFIEGVRIPCLDAEAVQFVQMEPGWRGRSVFISVRLVQRSGRDRRQAGLRPPVPVEENEEDNEAEGGTHQMSDAQPADYVSHPFSPHEPRGGHGHE